MEDTLIIEDQLKGLPPVNYFFLFWGITFKNGRIWLKKFAFMYGHVSNLVSDSSSVRGSLDLSFC
jgi:hypothetical protein